MNYFRYISNTLYDIALSYSRKVNTATRSVSEKFTNTILTTFKTIAFSMKKIEHIPDTDNNIHKLQIKSRTFNDDLYRQMINSADRNNAYIFNRYKSMNSLYGTNYNTY